MAILDEQRNRCSFIVDQKTGERCGSSKVRSEGCDSLLRAAPQVLLPHAKETGAAVASTTSTTTSTASTTSATATPSTVATKTAA